MTKNILLGVFAMVLVVSTQPCYSQQETQEIEKQNVMGTVVSTDSVASELVISTYQGNISFSVPNDAHITRGEDAIDLDDVEMGDMVTIDYYKNPSGKFEVISIIDSNVADTL